MRISYDYSAFFNELYIITREKTASFSTTNSFEASLGIETGAEPFGVGVKRTGMVGYGFSATSESSVGLSYTFSLNKGDAGYIVMVTAQISAELRNVFS
ncbi:hypothetical protein CPB97_011988 [Podila verticillata]|nr:hypothetical protein CPB97_011988 [Podila verticillata]